MQPNPAETASNLVVILSSDDEEENTTNNASSPNYRQIVLYDPTSNGSCGFDPEPEPDPISCMPPLMRHCSSPKVLPAVGEFTVQCARCFKWRLMPTKEKYEEIREHISEQPFWCELAKAWRPEISCHDPADVEQDGSRLWAIDKPNIAQTPAGWERELRIRGEGSTKFADVYYIAPSGKRLRSIVEVQKYLLAHPEFIEQGVTLSQFSFKIPRPLQENYVRKRTACLTAPGSETNLITSRLLEPRQANPSSSLDDPTAMWLGGSDFPGSSSMNISLDMSPVKKRAPPSV